MPDASDPLRIRMAIREDALSVLGGDTVQMQQTAAGLRDRGHFVEESIGPPTDHELEACDVVHLFNLQTPVFSLEVAERAKRLNKPLALSTIIWDFGADKLLRYSGKWRLLSKLLGRGMARSLAQRRVEAAGKADRESIRRILSLSDVWLPNSHAEEVQLRSYGVAGKPYRVVPNGIDPVRFDPGRQLPFPLGLANAGLESKGYLLIAARLDIDKNQLEFCRALSDSGIPIVLCGPAPEAAYLEACKQVCSCVLEPSNGDDLVALMLHARVHALPSYRETPGLANLEAAALGCSIVSTEVGSAREYFGESAFYCAPWSAASMKDAALQAWRGKADAGLSARMRTEFTWDRAAAETLAAYRVILRHGG